MSAPLEALSRLLPPPAGPVAGPPWERSKAECGFEFPTDYRAFVERYGGGKILVGPDEWPVTVMSPCSVPWAPGRPSGFAEYMFQVENLELGHEMNQWDGPDSADWTGPYYPDLPEPGGLLPWGHSPDGDTLYWSTVDQDPERWPVVMLARGPAVVLPFDGGMVDFLLAVLGGEHFASQWMTDPVIRWRQDSDWLQRT